MSGKDVGMRYECVFRESGAGLRLETKKRFGLLPTQRPAHEY